MTTPSILYNNLLRDTTAYSVLTDNSLAAYPFANCYDGMTSTQAGFTGLNQYIVLDFGSAIAADAIGIARHNMGDVSCTVYLAGSADNITYTPVQTINPTTNAVTYYAFTGASYRYWRLEIDSTGTSYFADIFLGERLDLERGQQGGFIKPLFANDDDVVANVTRGNNVLSITSNSRPSNVDFRLDYYTAAFFANWASVVTALKTHPVYINWDSTSQAFYCWPRKKIPEPSYSNGIVGRYNVTLQMTGFTE